MASFFGCRLIWGSYQSWNLYMDVWSELTKTTSTVTAKSTEALQLETLSSFDQFGPREDHAVPVWLLLTYLVSNTLLGFLNFYWFGKMIQALRKRFTPTPKITKQSWNKCKFVHPNRSVHLLHEGRRLVAVRDPEKKMWWTCEGGRYALAFAVLLLPSHWFNEIMDGNSISRIILCSRSNQGVQGYWVHQ